MGSSRKAFIRQMSLFQWKKYTFSHGTPPLDLQFEDEGQNEKKNRHQRFLRVVRFTQTRDTFLPTTKKGRNGEKDKQN